MSGLEEVTFGGLWTVVLVLMLLLLLLYRQVDRAYREASGEQGSPIAAGAEAPSIEILNGDQVTALTFGGESGLTFLVFVSTHCASCRLLLEELVKPDVIPGQVVVLVSGEGFSEFLDAERRTFSIHWLAHPPDAIRSYGVARVPLGYLLRGGTILGSRVLTSDRSVSSFAQEILAEAATLEPSAEPRSRELATS
jgi:hypothetical protein